MVILRESLAALKRPQPLASQAYEAIREGIVTGDLTSGERITERDLASRLDVSPTPVREALRRLEQEGLVERAGPRTLVIVSNSEQALRELLYAQVVLRAALARFAAEKITDEQIAELEEIIAEIRERVDDTTEEELLDMLKRFDAVVAEAASSPTVSRLVDSTTIIGRQRRLEAVGAARGTKRSAGRTNLKARRDLVTAFKAHEPDRAERLVRDRLLASRDFLLAGRGAA